MELLRKLLKKRLRLDAEMFLIAKIELIEIQILVETKFWLKVSIDAKHAWF